MFLDTADPAEIEKRAELGLVDGVTTNPSLIRGAGVDFKRAIGQICDLVEGPVSAEVAATDRSGMIDEGRVLADIADNVVVKIPLTWDGLAATRALSDEGIDVNVTLCFSAAQALMAAKAGAAYVSPFIGRLDDQGEDGLGLIAKIRAIFDAHPELETAILAASIRSVAHVEGCAEIGADSATLPLKIFDALVDHPLTEKGLATFVEDWKATGQSIL